MPRANLEDGARMYPLILGHEFSGTVDRVGSQVTKVQVGDKIAGCTIDPGPLILNIQKKGLTVSVIIIT